jgi:hypothetical protein
LAAVRRIGMTFIFGIQQRFQEKWRNLMRRSGWTGKVLSSVYCMTLVQTSLLGRIQKSGSYGSFLPFRQSFEYLHVQPMQLKFGKPTVFFVTDIPTLIVAH